VAKSKAVVVKRPVAPQARAAKDPKADALNSVLDKISAAGIESLTNDEKRLLEEMSKKLRGP
jgi:hypothetical protein